MIDVKVDARQLAAVQEFLKGLPHGALSVIVPAVNEYLIGDENHGLMHEPSYQHITREEGFPNSSFTTSTGKVVKGYSSQKQFNYVMWAISQGIITPGVENRNHNLQNSFVTYGDLYRQTIKNTAPYSKWVIGNTMQTNMHRLIGWRRVAQNVQDNIKGAFRHANAKLKEWLKDKSSLTWKL